MEEQLKGAAWSVGLWGVLSVIFGALVLAWPGITLKVFLIILGVYLLAAGVTLGVGSMVNRGAHWLGGAMIGALSAVAGLYVFANPKISALAVLTVIAIWTIAAGAMSMVAGFEGKNNWWMILSGGALTLFGFYIFANPGEGALSLVWLLGLTMIFSGILQVIVAMRLGAFSRRRRAA
ncbi:hypothetical protein A3A68_01510 [Candidatus Saccharibacteria bacterium RIFCSPLOWO2_01_FULL_48_13]|nr:MAG: hypothetical protein A2884_02530 [Candidatus Saccharibacteria bacterium RIFCSPHIGHO2_01_FULL_48_12]OGL37426.1 MAG: hypothetical protein A3A68_01510 [Candidatus Saccharibacteria bacterium RIFCSPLOWO2_01_FULL_48_13]